MDYPVFTDDPIRDAEARMERQDQLSDEHDARVADWIERIWDACVSPYSAEGWAWNHECLINDTPAILEAAAHARRSGDYEYLGRMVMARLDAWAKQTAEYMMEEQ